MIVNTYAGAANIEKIYWDVAQNYGASPRVMFTRVVFFGALPLIFAGLKIALAVSFIVWSRPNSSRPRPASAI